MSDSRLTKPLPGLTVHDLKKNDKGKVPSNSKADSTQPAAFKAPDAKVETIASRAAGDELAVNGGFDTPKWSIAKEGQGLPWVYVKPNAGTIRSYAQAMAGQTGVKAGGLTAATFAWQDVDAIGSNQNFELHREKDGNTAADVHVGRTVAQTVNTTPGASYTFSIRHSGRSKGNAGGVTLLTGPDKDHLSPSQTDPHHGLQDRPEVRGQDRRCGNRRLHALRFHGRHGRQPRTVGSFRRLGILRGHGHYPSRTIPAR